MRCSRPRGPAGEPRRRSASTSPERKRRGRRGAVGVGALAPSRRRLVGEPTSFDRRAGAAGDWSGKSLAGAKPRLPTAARAGNRVPPRRRRGWPQARLSPESGKCWKPVARPWNGPRRGGRRPREAPRGLDTKCLPAGGIAAVQRRFREGKHGKERSDPVRVGRRPPGSWPESAYPRECG